MQMQTAIGFILGAIIAFLAWRARSLNRSGAWAAALTGGLVFGLGGLAWAAVLLTFFISSSALSRLFARRKARVEEKYAKGSQRDWGQVLANGGLGALLAIANWLLPDQSWPWFAFTGAMAAVTADTWATELGVFNPTLPRLITSGKVVERGTSGAVTLLGYLAVLGGAALVGGVAAIFDPGHALLLIGSALVGGLAGSTIDSVLGATLQSIYYCPTCQKETERHPNHSCGTPTSPQRGWRWMSNDWVNFLCSLVGAGAALAVWGFLQ
jgi:uncharacterized protein (TIGR00297 family)